MHGWQLEGEWMTLHKPTGNGSSNAVPKYVAGSEGFLTPFADLTAFLCSSSWPDGSPRELGTLLVMLGGNGWRLKVRDPNGARYAFYAASTLQDALTGLDMGLAEDDLDWRPEKPWEKGKR